MTHGGDKRDPSENEPEPTVIDEELSNALSSAMNSHAHAQGAARFAQPVEPADDEPESDGQETLVWESSMLTAEQWAGTVEHTQVAPPERYAEESTRALDSHDLEELEAPHVSTMSYV